MDEGIVDVETIIYNAVQFMYETSRKDGDPENVNFGQINYDAIHMSKDDPDWNTGDSDFEDAQHEGKPTQVVYFSSTFDNRTDHAQEHSISASSVKSTMQISLTKGANFGKGSGFGVKLPLEGLKVPDSSEEGTTNEEAKRSASSLFGPTCTLLGQSMETKYEESSWSHDDKITVPERSKIQAKIVVTEHHHAAPFTLKTKLKGKVSVTVTDPLRNNSTVRYMQMDILEAVERELSKLPEDVVKLENKHVVITTKGRVNMRYGVNKNVVLTTI